MLSKTRDQKAAKRFFYKALGSTHVQTPRVITVDKNLAYPVAIRQLKKEKEIPNHIQIRQTKYLNNIVEQDYRFIKKVGIKIISNSSVYFAWNRGHAYVEEGAN
jgi:transposase, IS6 family